MELMKLGKHKTKALRHPYIKKHARIKNKPENLYALLYNFYVLYDFRQG